MTEVGQADLSRLLHSKRNEFSAIVTSRKRKLRELFAVATHADSLPLDAFTNPDAPAPTPAENKFLQDSDILQGKTLNELNIPRRPPASVEPLKHILSTASNAATEKKTLQPSVDVQNGKPRTSQHGGQSKQTDSAGKGASATVRQPVTASSALLRSPAGVQTQPGSNGLTKASVNSESPAAIVAKTPVTPTKNGDSGVPTTAEPTAQKSVAAEPAPEHSATRPTDGLIGGKANDRGESREDIVLENRKASQAASTPDSSSPTATDTAMRPVSPDTSPDHDASEIVNIPEREAKSGNEAGDDDVEEINEPGNVHPEDGTIDDDTTRESLGSVDSNGPQGSRRPLSVGSEQTQPGVLANGISESRSEPTAKPSASEVPDSQDVTPEQMELDDPEAARTDPTGVVQSILSTRELNIPTQHAPTPLQTDKAALKASSQVPERAVTRVSSGAMRLKSVSEIVGESPRLAQSKSEQQAQLTPTTSAPQSPASKNKSDSLHRRDRSRGQTTVLFGKQPKRFEEKAVVPGQREVLLPSEDYFTPLFLQNYASSSSWMQPLEKILFHANKTLTTPDTNLAIQEHQACRILKKVYNMQQSEKWSLRQPKRCPEPTRPPSQWDMLLREMKWMRTDFREERKWKMTVARNLAHACAEWHEATPDERKSLQIPAQIPPKLAVSNDATMTDAGTTAAADPATPELVSSGDMESPLHVDELNEDFAETNPPSAIFSLQDDDVVFALRRSPTSDQLLEELPMYGSPLQVPKMGLMGPEYDPDAHWRRAALPLSKYVEGAMKLKVEGPPHKRSRYSYENEDSDDEIEAAFVANQFVHRAMLPPTTNEVALFNPESKPIRDRLHAGHQFRPPSEHPMPTQNFYECRSPSQWTMAEDDELRNLVREYSYNWSLISNMLAAKSHFTSGAERRTPWECFERWINLEGLPADMQKTQYFKAYNSRIEAAQRVIVQQNQLAAQQASASGSTVTPVRRRQSTPLRVERRRNQKHLTLIDAMRKLAKKRETTIQKQQHTASQNAAIKKPNEPVTQKPTKTPRDYSLLRWERDQALAEKMAQYAQRQEAQRRAALQARQQQLQANQGVPVARHAGPVGPNGQHAVAPINAAGRGNIPPQLAAAAAVAAAAGGENRARVPMQAAANGTAVVGAQTQMNGGLVPPQMNGTPQAQLQVLQNLQAQQRLAMPGQPADVNLMLRAQRISEQQRAAVQLQQAHQQQQQQQHLQQQLAQHQQQVAQQQQAHHARAGSGTPVANQQNSPPNNLRNGVNGINQQNFMANAQAMMAQFNTTGNNLAATVGANGLHMPSVPNGSPGPRPPSQISATIAAQISQLEAQFKAKSPNLTPEQARHLATEHLTRTMMAHRQNAMNAAAGGANQASLANSIAATTSPHQYAALLRQQQQAQQQQQHAQQPQAVASSTSPVPAHQRQSSGSATPSVPK